MLDKFMRWLKMFFRIVQDIAPETEQLQESYDFIAKWKDIYKGFHKPWHEVPTKNGKRNMSTIKAAKLLCSEMSSLIFTEKVEITVDNPELNKYVQEVLEDNGFSINQSQMIEYMLALGGAANKFRRENDKTVIDYCPADTFVPIQWTNSKITGAVFTTTTVKGKYVYILVAKVIYDGQNSITEHTLFRQKPNQEEQKGVQVELSEVYPNLQKVEIVENVSGPIFSYIKPNIGNNIDMNSPLGISFFANSEDTLKSLDICFDSFQREFVLGRKRITVPSSYLRTVEDPVTKERYRYYDPNADVYEGLNMDENSSTVEDNTQTLRVEEHIAAINAFLNLLCIQSGVTPGFISFDAKGGLKTATEVVSENSKTYRTKVKQEVALKKNLKELVTLIVEIGVMHGDIKNSAYEIDIKFDDSIIEDKVAERLRDQMEVGLGLMSKERFIKKWGNLDDNEYEEEIKLIKGQKTDETI